MDLILGVHLIHSNADFNPACFDFTEMEARERGLWRDSRPMPTILQIKEALERYEREEQVNKYRDQRKREYEKLNLTFERYIELLIEEDMQGIQKFKNDRDKVRKQFPKKGKNSQLQAKKCREFDS